MTRAGDVVVALQVLAAGRDSRKRGRGMRDAIGCVEGTVCVCVACVWTCDLAQSRMGWCGRILLPGKWSCRRTLEGMVGKGCTKE
jgi:hypothetical protein